MIKNFILTIKYKIISFFNLIKFNLNKVKKPTVLLVEINECHSELFPSFVYFLNKLNYEVEVAVLPSLKGFLPKLNANKIYYFSRKWMTTFLAQKKLKDYDFVLFSSYKLYYKKNSKDDFTNIFEHIENFDKINSKFGSIITLHHTEDIQDVLEKTKGAVVLSENLKENDKLFVLNPCYFLSNLPKNKNRKTKFIVTGKLEYKRKNPKLLFDSIQELLEVGIKNFEIVAVGAGCEIEVPKKIKPFINFKGRLSFDKMYKELQGADFFLPLLDSKIDAHKRYLESGTSGSFQIIRGFLLPPVIEKKFAEIYGFYDLNSIIYENNSDFSNMLKKCIELDNEKYLEFQNELLKQRNEIQEKSVLNLSNLIDLIKK